MNDGSSKKIIFWDIGNVLVKFSETEFIDKLKHNRSKELSEEYFEIYYREIMDQSFLGLITLNETWLRIFSLLNVKENQKEFWKNQYKAILNEELLNFMKNNNSDYYFGLISDLHQIAHDCLVVFHNGIFKLCHPKLVYLSNQTGYSKKNHGAGFFRDIFDSTGKDVGDIIYIDDDQVNIDTVESVGVKGILFPKLSNNESWFSANKVFFDNFHLYQDGKDNRENN